MFSIVYKNAYYVEISYGGRIIESPIAIQTDTCITTASINKIKDKYPISDIYSVLNRYLDEKGDHFKMRLMDTLIDVDEDMTESLFNKISKIFDLFELEDIENKITKYFNKVKLTDEIDTYTITNKTYSKQDYVKLCCLILLVKTIMHIFIKHIIINKFNSYTIPDVYFIEIISKHKHFQTDVFNKFLLAIREDIENTENYLSLINLSGINIDENNIEVLEAGKIFIKKLYLRDICRDTSEDNSITMMYNYLGNQLKIIETKFQNKQINQEEESNDKESILEAYKQTSFLSYDVIETYKWLTNDVEKILRELEIETISINQDIENLIRNKLGISPAQIELLKIFYINFIPEAIYLHLDSNSINNLLIVMYSLIKDEFPDISVKLLNQNTNKPEILKSSLNKAVKDEFLELFPITIGDKKENIAYNNITELYKKYYYDVDKTNFFKFVIKYLR